MANSILILGTSRIVAIGPTGHATAMVRKMSEAISNSDLEALFRVGHPDSLRLAFDAHQRKIYSYLLQRAPDHASDLTQEVFLAAWRSREKFDPLRGSLAGWLMGIAHFKLIDHFRIQYRDASVAAGDLIDLSGPGATWDDPSSAYVATRILVAEALENLDEQSASWIRLAFFEGMSHSEIADAAGAPLGTVKSTIRRALGRMRRDLEAFDV